MLCDFGCSEFFLPKSGQLSHMTKGTYRFMAPEMFGADKSVKLVRGRQSDIWAAGVTLFNLLTKRYPFESSNVFDLANKIRGESADFSPLENLESELLDLLERMLEKDPEKRIGIY